MTVRQIETQHLILIAIGTATQVIEIAAMAVTHRGTPVKIKGMVTEAEASGMLTVVRTKAIAAGTKGMVTAVTTEVMVIVIATKDVVTAVETMVGSVEAMPIEMKDMLAMSRATQSVMKAIVAGTMATPAESKASTTGILVMEAGSKAVIGEMMAELAGPTGMPAQITVLAGMSHGITMLAGSTVPAGKLLSIHEWRKPAAPMIWHQIAKIEALLVASQITAGVRRSLLWRC